MTSRESLSAKATTLRSLHHAPDPLLLVNVWDVGGACAVASMGYRAIATSSWAISHSLGYPDGERVSRDQMLDTISRIAAAVTVPVSADVEGGYAETPEQMAATANALIEAGAVGLNLEDGEADRTRLAPIARQVEKIIAVREAAAAAGVPLVLNARTDAFWWKGVNPDTRWADIVERANAYRQAGADCIFVLGLKTADDIARFLRESPGPLNIFAGPGTPSVPELRQMGVARVSLAAGPYRAAIGVLKKIAGELRATGTYSTLTDYCISAEEASTWFA